MPIEMLWEVYFQICWHSWGYGLNVTPAELDEMQLDELLWYRDRVNQQRAKKQ